MPRRPTSGAVSRPPRSREAANPTPGDGVATTPAPSARPDVIIDFSVDRGLLFVTLRNIGAASAFDVVTRFDRAFRGLGGEKDLSALALFRSLLFLPPGKQLTQLVDAADAYFARDEPTRLTATITYADRDGRRYSDVIPHDLTVYRDLAQAEPR
jgi:hypothetical protein